MRGGEKGVDKADPGVRAGVVFEALDLLEGGRQSREVERGAADAGGAVGFRSGGEVFFFQPGQDEGVHGLVGPVGGGDGRKSGGDERLEGPMLAPVFGGGSGGGLLGPGEILPNPCGQGFDGLLRKFGGFFRHGLEAFGMRDREDEPAGGSIFRIDHRAIVAASEDGGAGVEAEAVVLFFGSVAAVTIFRQQGADFGFEEFDVGGRDRGASGWRWRSGRRRDGGGWSAGCGWVGGGGGGVAFTNSG